MNTPRNVVERLVGDRERFLKESREGPFVIRQQVDPADFLGWPELNRLVRHTGVTKNLAKDGTRKFGVSVREVAAGLKDGVTLQLEDVAPHSPRIAAIAGELSSFLGGDPVDVYVYLSPSSKHFAFPPHADEVDVFVAQLTGRKHWQVFERGSSERVVLDVVLEPGDVLFMRRGDPHRVVCEGDEPSLQMNLRVFPTGAGTFSQFLAAEMCSDKGLHSTMPYPATGGDDDPGRIAWTRDVLADFHAWLSAQDAPDLLDRFLNHRTRQVPANLLALPDVIPGQGVVDRATPVALAHPQLLARVSDGHLHALGGCFRLPAGLGPVVSTLVSSPSHRWTAEEVAARHDVTVEGALHAIRQLIEVGVLQVRQ